MNRLGSRAAQSLLVLVVATSLNFVLPHLAPGDPVTYLYQGAAGSLTAEQVSEVRADYGLDRPLPVQYVAYWQGLVQGDLGTSIQHNRPVVEVLLERLPWTLLLVGTATVVASVLGVLAGAIAARRRGTRGDIGLVTGVLSLDAMPGFWIGMVLVAVFSVDLQWFPSFGAVAIGAPTGGIGWVLGVLHRLVLPVSTLVLATIGGTFLLTRGAMVSVLDETFVQAARGRGFGTRRVVYLHALRNALLPVATTISLNVAVMLSGAVVIETVFAYPGLGGLIYDATIARDYPVLRGAFLLVTVGVVLANLAADLLYPVLDPRVRRDGRTRR